MPKGTKDVPFVCAAVSSGVVVLSVATAQSAKTAAELLKTPAAAYETTSSDQTRYSMRTSGFSSTQTPTLVVVRCAVNAPLSCAGWRLNQERTKRWFAVSTQAGPVMTRAMPTRVRLASPALISTPVAASVAWPVVEASSVSTTPSPSASDA